MDKDEAVRIAKRYLNFLQKKNINIVGAYLFGSFAKGADQLDSDIDLAIIFNELQDEIDMQIQLMKFRRKFDLRIEPHPFTKKDLDGTNPMLNEILKTGLSLLIT